jgi:outer membrane murein-binding lipoprotein Lpp
MNLIFEQNEWLFFAGRTTLLAVGLLGFALALGSWRRSGRRDMQRMFEETRTLSDLAQRLAAQIAQLEARIEERRELAAAAEPAARGYQLALQLARNGASPEDIVNACGVTRHEAQLLTQLHNPARR